VSSSAYTAEPTEVSLPSSLGKKEGKEEEREGEKKKKRRRREDECKRGE
jgi:hypothetical protein